MRSIRRQLLCQEDSDKRTMLTAYGEMAKQLMKQDLEIEGNALRIVIHSGSRQFEVAREALRILETI